MADQEGKKKKMVGTVIQATGPGFMLEKVVNTLEKEFGFHGEPTWAAIESDEASRLGVVTVLITLSPCAEEDALAEKERGAAEGADDTDEN